jgi:hypothetical protein
MFNGEKAELLFKVLFTSRVFEGMGGDYPVSRNFTDGLFTRLRG